MQSCSRHWRLHQRLLANMDLQDIQSTQGQKEVCWRLTLVSAMDPLSGVVKMHSPYRKLSAGPFVSCSNFGVAVVAATSVLQAHMYAQHTCC